MKNLKKLFLKYCLDQKLEINTNQIKIIELLSKFRQDHYEVSFFKNLLFNTKKKLGFYLIGDVGVGKTMILNFFYKNLDFKKKRLHFNEFMINFHDFVHKNKNDNSIECFVKELKKKYEILYFDEFQVTNIVDAMILGKLFEVIFKENIKLIITSNTKIQDLYKDGLQREQFMPFISIMNDMCNQHNLVIDDDYRKLKTNYLYRFFYPLNEESNFKVNQLFRKLTKGKKRNIKKLIIKDREFLIKNYFEKVARFDFNDLCNRNIGAEDYIAISEICEFIIIDNVPVFNDENSNKQQRFITLIDIIYEKKIPLTISSMQSLDNANTSKNLELPFRRTLSRLHELTSLNLT